MCYRLQCDRENAEAVGKTPCNTRDKRTSEERRNFWCSGFSHHSHTRHKQHDNMCMCMWLDSRPRSYSTMSPASICRLRSSSIAACMRLRGSRSGTGHATPPSASHVDSSSLCVGYWGESTTCILGHAPALLGDLRRRYELLWEEVDQPLRAGEGGQPLRTGEFPTRANLTAERRAFSLAAVVAGESTRRSGACRHLWQSVSLSAIVSRSCREKRGRALRGACARRSRSRCLAVARDGR